MLIPTSQSFPLPCPPRTLSFSKLKEYSMIYLTSTQWIFCFVLIWLPDFTVSLYVSLSFLGGSVVQNLPADAGDAGDNRFHPWVRKIP